MRGKNAIGLDDRGKNIIAQFLIWTMWSELTIFEPRLDNLGSKPNTDVNWKWYEVEIYG
jgi:hypothetical protein